MITEKSGTLSGSINIQGNRIQLDLPVILFEDGGCKVVYCPAVNVYGYGETEHAAQQSLEISLEEFFSYTLHKKTLSSELEKLGWKIKKKKFTPPAFASLLDKNKTLHNILNTREFTKVERSFNIPAIA